MPGLRTVVYKVSDMASAKEWYTRAFATAPYFDEPFYVGFNIGGFELGLHPETEPSSQKGDNVVAYWAVEEVEKTYESLLSIGATAHEAPSDVGSGIIIASVKDPFGNVLGLIYNPHFTLGA
jgi:predicted enzyme related to lactoylglutathione lyase